MARAEVLTEEPVAPPVSEVVLHLTEDEALLIGALTGERGGPDPGFDIYTALSKAGYGQSNSRYQGVAADIRRGF